MPLIRYAAGLRRAHNRHEWVRNVLRAVNFVTVTFAFCVLLYPVLLVTVLQLMYIPDGVFTTTDFIVGHIVMAVIILTYAVLFSIFVTPRLLTFPAKGTISFRNAINTENKGYALALAMSSAIALIFWLGIATGISDSFVEVYINLLPLSVMVLINVLLLVSTGTISWKIRRGYSSNARRATLWVLNMVVFAGMLSTGLFGWGLVLSIYYSSSSFNLP